MSDGVLSLSDVSDTAVEQSETNSADASSDYASLKDACEMVGADYDSARSYVDENGKKSELIELCNEIDADSSVAETYEEYRRMNDVHRIIVNHLRGHDADFDVWTTAFYYGENGTKDDPADGSYNDVQSTAADTVGNLPFYKALFPEPNTDHWDSQPVLWQERPDEDSHIYVTENFATEYDEFSRDINGKSRPLPPSNGELQSSADDSGSDSADYSDVPINPGSYSVDMLDDVLRNGQFSEDELRAIRAQEVATDDRKTAKDKIDREMRKVSDSSDDGDNSESNEAIAGRIIENHGVSLQPETVVDLLEDNMTEDEIVERFA